MSVYATRVPFSGELVKLSANWMGIQIIEQLDSFDLKVDKPRDVELDQFRAAVEDAYSECRSEIVDSGSVNVVTQLDLKDLEGYRNRLIGMIERSVVNSEEVIRLTRLTS